MDYERVYYYYGFFFMTCFDYWQVILSGTFRALGEMDLFSKFNFVTYFVIICPLTAYLAFYTGAHYTMIDGQEQVSFGFGPMGTWYSFIIGLAF